MCDNCGCQKQADPNVTCTDCGKPCDNCTCNTQKADDQTTPIVGQPVVKTPVDSGNNSVINQS